VQTYFSCHSKTALTNLIGQIKWAATIGQPRRLDRTCAKQTHPLIRPLRRLSGLSVALKMARCLSMLLINLHGPTL